MNDRDPFGDYLIFLACYLLLAAVALVVLVMFVASGCRETSGAVEFAHKPKDRPVLESVQQVWEARTTGVSEFYFDGTHYVVENMPKNYVDYSSWYVRMP